MLDDTVADFTFIAKLFARKAGTATEGGTYGAGMIGVVTTKGGGVTIFTGVIILRGGVITLRVGVGVCLSTVTGEGVFLASSVHLPGAVSKRK